MPFYLRKSVRLGPIRFNLSKSGVGASAGVTGFRIGMRPNGKSYLHAGRYGLYYREELGSKNNNKSLLHEYNDSKIIDEYNTTHYKTASSEKLVPNSRKKLLQNLNDSYNSIRLDYFCAVSFFVLSFIAFQTSNKAGLIVILFGLIASIVLAFWEAKRRTIRITYDFDEDNESRFKKIISALNSLASNDKLWSLIDSKLISDTHESKLNSGASSIVNRSDVQIGTGNPPWVETNISVPTLQTKLQTYYMMPDGILVYDNKGVGFVEYNDVSICINTTRFIEENPQNDSKVVDKTWLHPNKNGGPDRRFSNNYEIPICLYGELKINSSSGMVLYLMTSKYDSPSSFLKEFQKGIKIL